MDERRPLNEASFKESHHQGWGDHRKVIQVGSNNGLLHGGVSEAHLGRREVFQSQKKIAETV